MSESGRDECQQTQPGKRSATQNNDSSPRSKQTGAGIARTITQFEKLLTTIESDVVPRLLLAHGNGSNGTTAPLAIDVVDVEEFARLVLNHEAAVAIGYAVALRERGVAMEQLFLELLAPAGRHLGLLWENDICDFTQVTVGLMRLQEVLRALSPSFEREMSHRENGRHILLAPTPGEQHTFGLFMVSEFLRNAGWSVLDEPQPSGPELTQLVSQRWFSLVGLSLSCETRVEDLRNMIEKLRSASRNDQLGVLVGGPLFLTHPELVSQVGADCTAIDGRDAVRQAESLRAAQNASETERGRVG